MFTSMVDETTFEISGQVFEIGDKVELIEEEQHLLEDIQRLDSERLTLQQSLIDMVHMADKNIVPGLREPAHTINGVSLDLSYALNRLLHAIQTRIGGKLPLDFEDNYKGIKVRGKRQGEPMNFTVQSVKQSLNFFQFEDARNIAVKIAADDKTFITFPLEQNKKWGFQPIVCAFGTDMFTFEGLMDLLQEYIKEKPGIPNILFMVGPEQTLIATVDDRNKQRSAKIIECLKGNDLSAICFVHRSAVQKDKLTVTVGYMTNHHKKTGTIDLSVSDKVTTVGDVKETFEVPGGEVYVNAFTG
jgi:hypothetical protein